MPACRQSWGQSSRYHRGGHQWHQSNAHQDCLHSPWGSLESKSDQKNLEVLVEEQVGKWIDMSVHPLFPSIAHRTCFQLGAPCWWNRTNYTPNTTKEYLEHWMRERIQPVALRFFFRFFGAWRICKEMPADAFIWPINITVFKLFLTFFRALTALASLDVLSSI